MATNLRSLGRTAAKAVRERLREAKRRRIDAREARRKPPFSRKQVQRKKETEREIAIEREKIRRGSGTMM